MRNLLHHTTGFIRYDTRNHGFKCGTKILLCNLKFDIGYMSYRVRDFFRIGLYHDTMRTIKKIHNAKDVKVKIKIARALVDKLKKVVYFDECSTVDENECKSFEELCNWLDYFSDRWSMSRLNRVVAFLERMDEGL